MREPLTKMQRNVLAAMVREGPAAFTGEEARKLGFGVFGAKHGGIIIRAYSYPAFFLERRGMIEQQERNVPGVWFRVTAKGRAALKASS